MLKPSTLKYQILLACFTVGLVARAAFAAKQICVRPGSYDNMAAKALGNTSRFSVAISDAKGCYIGVTLYRYGDLFHIFAKDADGRMFYSDFASSPQSVLDGFVKLTTRPGALEAAMKGQDHPLSQVASPNWPTAIQVTPIEPAENYDPASSQRGQRKRAQYEQYQRDLEAIREGKPVPPGNVSVRQALALAIMAGAMGGANALKTAYQCPPHCGRPSPDDDTNLQEALGSGAVLKLDDGTLWKVDLVDRVDSALWSAGEEIINPDTACSVDCTLINSDDGSKVHATRIY